VTPCSSEVAQLFGATHRFHLQVEKLSQIKKPTELVVCSDGFFLGLIIRLECRGDKFLRNVGHSPTSMFIYPEHNTFRSQWLENLRVKTAVHYSSLHLPISSSENLPFLYSGEDLIDRVIKRKPCFWGRPNSCLE
jgi:hypothetical protein